MAGVSYPFVHPCSGVSLHAVAISSRVQRAMSDLELCCGERLHSAQIQCPATGLRWLPLELIDGTVSLPKHPDHIPMLEVRVRCAHVRGGACALARACVRTCAWAWLRALAQERMKIFGCGVHVRVRALRPQPTRV